jgi:hypothetical protein
MSSLYRGYITDNTGAEAEITNVIPVETRYLSGLTGAIYLEFAAETSIFGGVFTRITG